MNYKVIACTNTAYVGWYIGIPALHAGALEVTRSDGVTAIFEVDHILNRNGIATLSNSNFVAQLKEI